MCKLHSIVARVLLRALAFLRVAGSQMAKMRSGVGFTCKVQSAHCLRGGLCSYCHNPCTALQRVLRLQQSLG
jgi:hypothetical protein